MMPTRTIMSLYVKPLKKTFTMYPELVKDNPDSAVHVTRIERTTKNGDHAPIPWLDVYLDDAVVEVLESDCIILCEEKPF